jgi:hypothetical protein
MKLVLKMRRAASLGCSGNLLLVEAIAALGAAAAAIRFGAVPLGEPRANLTVLADELSWTVQAAARIAPFRTVCFQQGLALQRMVRRRGIDARLHYAIGKDESDRLAAHVWVSADGRALIGEQHDNVFMTVATYP